MLLHAPQNDIMKDMLAASGAVAVLASEEDDEPVVVESVGAYAVVFDPLVGVATACREGYMHVSYASAHNGCEQFFAHCCAGWQPEY